MLWRLQALFDKLSGSYNSGLKFQESNIDPSFASHAKIVLDSSHSADKNILIYKNEIPGDLLKKTEVDISLNIYFLNPNHVVSQKEHYLLLIFTSWTTFFIQYLSILI